MVDLDALLSSPYTTALCVVIVCLCNALIQRALQFIPQRSGSETYRIRMSIVEKLSFWRNHAERYTPEGIRTRTAWALKESQKPPDRTAMPNINFFIPLLQALTNFGPFILFNFVFTPQILLRLPFDPPPVVRAFMQIGTPTTDPRGVSLHSLFMIGAIAATVFAEVIPMPRRDRPVVYASQPDIEAKIFYASDKPWVLENADKELLDFIDSQNKKHE